jgi:Predicted hydrolase of the metallo-beta-lactamase superfamily
LVHFSGHGYPEEIKKMYEWTKPYISIPIHGEEKHLLAHAQLAQASQVPHTKILENGKCIKLAPEDPEINGFINTAKLIVEGKNLYDSESNFIKDRRKYSFDGIFLVSIMINEDLSINKNVKISSNGLPEFNSDNFIDQFKENFIPEYMKMNKDQKSSDDIISELIKKLIRQKTKLLFSKKPEVKSHIIRIYLLIYIYLLLFFFIKITIFLSCSLFLIIKNFNLGVILTHKSF